MNDKIYTDRDSIVKKVFLNTLISFLTIISDPRETYSQCSLSFQKLIFESTCLENILH